MTRELVACAACGARRRDQDQAQAMLPFLSDGCVLNLAEAVKNSVESKRPLRVLELALSGPFIATLSPLPGYVQAYRWPDGRPVGKDRQGRSVVYSDLEQLPFEDRCFDLVVTSEVLPFVNDEMKAHAEVLRVLRPGGAHVASLMIDWPTPPSTQEYFRREGDNWVCDDNSPRQFKSPDGTLLPLRRRHGADLPRVLRSLGFVAALRRSSFIKQVGRRNATLMAVRAI